MTVIAWCLAALLAVLVAIAVTVGTPLYAFVFFAAVLAPWLAVGIWVRRDAQRRGYDGDRAGGAVVVLGPIGLAWWLGVRRGLEDKTS